jgi:hypothetical protein
LADTVCGGIPIIELNLGKMIMSVKPALASPPPVSGTQADLAAGFQSTASAPQPDSTPKRAADATGAKEIFQPWVPEWIRDPEMHEARTASEEIGAMLSFDSGYSIEDAYAAAANQAQDWRSRMPREALENIYRNLDILSGADSGSFNQMKGAPLLRDAVEEVLW